MDRLRARCLRGVFEGAGLRTQSECVLVSNVGLSRTTLLLFVGMNYLDVMQVIRGKDVRGKTREGFGALHCDRGGAERGSFKLDLDFPGDMPHRISPLSRTRTRRSSPFCPDSTDRKWRSTS
ncbi:hypothetical protein XENOCAPTIV_007764 [Xenoophorus captivus]|uniref:Uncharacterized protein n=1 Tax=Xenoophorus captivus TaxID=1517983 RepID=A0ABV0QRN0_9TELE